jgi:hypothetical protein
MSTNRERVCVTANDLRKIRHEQERGNMTRTGEGDKTRTGEAVTQPQIQRKQSNSSLIQFHGHRPVNLTDPREI